jgi:hypothetical protein
MNALNNQVFEKNILLVCVYAKDILNEKGIGFIKSAKTIDEAKSIIQDDNLKRNKGNLDSDGHKEGYFIMEYDMSLFNKNVNNVNNLIAVYNGHGIKIK